MSSVANTYGSTAHVSPLLRKLKKLGFVTPDSLLRLAVGRGCSHYAPADYDQGQIVDPGVSLLSDAELGIAMISGAQHCEPQLIRCAAQLLSAPHLDAKTLVRLARMERCEPVLGYIAEQARKWDEGRERFWDTLLVMLPRRSGFSSEAWPHPSRFVLQSGYRRGGGMAKAKWLRPQSHHVSR